jgi:hypothetical protein
MERAMEIEPTSEVWGDAGELGSFMPQVEGKTLVRERIQPGREPSCPQTRPLSNNRLAMKRF